MKISETLRIPSHCGAAKQPTYKSPVIETDVSVSGNDMEILEIFHGNFPCHLSFFFKTLKTDQKPKPKIFRGHVVIWLPNRQ